MAYLLDIYIKSSLNVKGHNYEHKNIFAKIFCLLISITLFLTSCVFSAKADTSASIKNDTSATTNTTDAAEAEIDPYDGVVETMFEAKNNFVGGSYRFDVSIPKVNISPKIDEIVNAYINEIFYELAYPQEERGDALLQINYEYYINGDILSLLIKEHQGMDINSNIYTVNIDLKKETIITLPYYLKRIGERWLDIKEVMTKHWLYENMYYIITYDGYNFYLNENNELNIIASVISNEPGKDPRRYHFSYNVIDKTTQRVSPIMNI